MVHSLLLTYQHIIAHTYIYYCSEHSQNFPCYMVFLLHKIVLLYTNFTSIIQCDYLFINIHYQVHLSSLLYLPDKNFIRKEKHLARSRMFQEQPTQLTCPIGYCLMYIWPYGPQEQLCFIRKGSPPLSLSWHPSWLLYILLDIASHLLNRIL